MRWTQHIQLLPILPTLKVGMLAHFAVLQLVDHHLFLFVEGSITMVPTSHF